MIRPTLPKLIQIAADRHRLKPSDLKGHCRQPEHIKARREVIWNALQCRHPYPLPQIGKALKKDHTTILHHAKAMGITARAYPRINS